MTQNDYTCCRGRAEMPRVFKERDRILHRRPVSAYGQRMLPSARSFSFEGGYSIMDRPILPSGAMRYTLAKWPSGLLLGTCLARCFARSFLLQTTSKSRWRQRICTEIPKRSLPEKTREEKACCSKTRCLVSFCMLAVASRSFAQHRAD